MSVRTSNVTKAVVVTRLEGLVNGLPKRLPNQQFPVGGTAFTVPMLVQLCKDLIDAIEAADAAQVGATKAVANAKAKKAQNLPVIRAVLRIVAATFADDATALADFDVQPAKARTPMTTAQKVAAKAKAQATRLARGTKGPKAKKEILGNVTGVNITPVTATTAPAAPAEPQTPVTTVAPPGATK